MIFLDMQNDSVIFTIYSSSDFVYFFVIKVVIFLYTLQSIYIYIYITHHLHSNDGINVMTVSDINF
jgi:hypothetical protein